jgi:hypothetical protein
MDSDLVSDNRLLIEHVMTQKPLARAVYQRILQRAECITQEIRRRFGVVNVAVQLIRETREEN